MSSKRLQRMSSGANGGAPAVFRPGTEKPVPPVTVSSISAEAMVEDTWVEHGAPDHASVVVPALRWGV